MAEPSLELLQIMLQRVLDRQDDHKREFYTLRRHMASLKRAMPGIRSDVIGHAQANASQQHEIEQLRARVGRIERRLDIAD